MEIISSVIQKVKFSSRVTKCYFVSEKSVTFQQPPQLCIFFNNTMMRSSLNVNTTKIFTYNVFYLFLLHEIIATQALEETNIKENVEGTQLKKMAI